MTAKSCRTSFSECLKGDNMNRVNKICSHPLWLQQMKQLAELERGRIFCKHGTEHLMDVARLAYIEDLEQGYGIEKELVYASALLHDVGKGRQYTEGIPHEKASAMLAGQILDDCGFLPKEKKEILEAISSHRDIQVKEQKNLQGLLYRADKRSRMCNFCEAYGACNWSEDKKNRQIYV